MARQPTDDDDDDETNSTPTTLGDHGAGGQSTFAGYDADDADETEPEGGA